MRSLYTYIYHTSRLLSSGPGGRLNYELAGGGLWEMALSAEITDAFFKTHVDYHERLQVLFLPFKKNQTKSQR